MLCNSIVLLRTVNNVKKEEKKTQVHEHLMTYEDYAKLPDDEIRYELGDGKLELMSPSPSARHQVIGFELQLLMKSACQTEYLILNAPLDVILSPTEIRQPDLIAIHRSRVGMITDRGIEGAPDLIVEILSPASIRRDKVQKRLVYAKYGIPEYWIMDPASETLEQYILQSSQYELVDVYSGEIQIRSEKLTCISCSVADVMRAVNAEFPYA